ncbi:MAG TPA: TIGR02996 domain-containing protein [Kofleriaceae bacterium]|jgi:uncharacterized protein (TIGR02996 family)
MHSLDRALALWRAKPTRAHAELVHRAGRLVRPDDRDEWLEAIREPALFNDQFASNWLLELARRPSDPRIGDAMVTMIETRTFDWGALSAIWKPLFQIFEAADATIAPRLRTIAERERTGPYRMTTRLAPKLDEIADALEARVEVDSPEARALAAELDQLEAKRRAVDDASLELFDAVWATPDDDAPRLVLADFLNEHAEPRGEFIALQLARQAGKLGASGRKREKKLLARNKRAWIGAIAPLVTVASARFERGFIVGAQLVPDIELELRFGDHPAWSTLLEFSADLREQARGPFGRMLQARARVVTTLTLGIA